jgi:hypothetical protein
MPQGGRGGLPELSHKFVQGAAAPATAGSKFEIGKRRAAGLHRHRVTGALGQEYSGESGFVIGMAEERDSDIMRS